MQKIIPFKKDILFKTSLSEIVSISLDHELNINNNLVNGKFIISGEYKMLNTSVDTEDFSYELPFTVDLDEKYILDNSTIDIDDFYYEIIKDNILRIGIDVLIDNIEEKEIIKTEEVKENIKEERCIEEESIKEDVKIENKVVNNNGETYKSYTVYIVRENDDIESIIKKYDTTKEELEKYNDLVNFKIGDKIIIPS